MTGAPEEWGPERTVISPPMDALATVTVSGEPITTLAVGTDSTLAVCVLTGEDTAGVDSEDIPAPAFTEDLSDPTETVPITGDSWVTITVAGARRLRFTAEAGETVALHLERAAEGDA